MEHIKERLRDKKNRTEYLIYISWNPGDNWKNGKEEISKDILVDNYLEIKVLIQRWKKPSVFKAALIKLTHTHTHFRVTVGYQRQKIFKTGRWKIHITYN